VGRVGRKNALLALAAAVVIAGIVVAVLSSGSASMHTPSATGAARARPSRPVSETAAAVSYLGLSRTQLRSKLRSGLSLSEVAAAIPGKSAHGLLELLVAARTAQFEASALARRLSPAARRPRIARLHARIEAQLERLPGYVDLAQSASYLGIPIARLRADLHAGKSLAQIADVTPGKSAAGLIGARVRGREAALEAEVATHAISRARASALIPALRNRIAREVERVPGG
jgi:hypothetical protein